MNEAEKLRFLQCEEIDKEKVGKEAKVKKRTTKKKRDPNMPKHAMTAFFCFMKSPENFIMYFELFSLGPMFNVFHSR